VEAAVAPAPEPPAPARQTSPLSHRLRAEGGCVVQEGEVLLDLGVGVRPQADEQFDVHTCAVPAHAPSRQAGSNTQQAAGITLGRGSHVKTSARCPCGVRSNSNDVGNNRHVAPLHPAERLVYRHRRCASSRHTTTNGSTTATRGSQRPRLRTERRTLRRPVGR
jgi:hypothetical protein